ncbi:hypothetical protein AVEN_171566-1 [Araneus ventricosus]|uniref:Uncharacterized protein n=1 Tax=Araneus ventricosus TaxID=182803 RepID=A0A4Y2K0H3_ARAVE|nr:hypothetical protein AVEN_171566-1 [Araneus ventricosus]
MTIPTETTISSKAIYFPRLKNRPERIVLRHLREYIQIKGENGAKVTRVATPAFLPYCHSCAVNLQAATARRFDDDLSAVHWPQKGPPPAFLSSNRLEVNNEYPCSQ